MTHLLIQADARKIPLADRSVHCVVTSPPYWGGSRDYGVEHQIGLERNPADYVDALVDIFLDVRRVLMSEGCLWLNIGDTYAASGKGGGGSASSRSCWDTIITRKGFRMPPEGYKMKDLTLVAFQVADALRRSGWYLRSTVIWRKPTAIEPMRLDRPAVSHEYLFLLSPSEHYQARNPGEAWWGHSVWTIATDGETDHPATMPRELARRCIKASCPEDGIVLDPFSGVSTTGVVALALKRRYIGCDLSADYLAQAKRRIERPHQPLTKQREQAQPLFAHMEDAP